MIQIKVVKYWIPYKKVGECICLYPPVVELEAPKIVIFFLNIIMFKKWESSLTLGLDAAK